MRILGVDYGLKRIGIAIGEAEVRMAFARPFLPSKGSAQKDAKQLAELAQAEECSLILLGLPLLESGEEGEQSQLTRGLVDELKGLGVEIKFWDERYSTSAAHSSLSHVEGRRRKELLDSEAARLMVAEYLASSDA